MKLENMCLPTTEERKGYSIAYLVRDVDGAGTIYGAFKNESSAINYKGDSTGTRIEKIRIII